MIPIHLNPDDVRVALVGNAALTVRRLQWLREAGCEPDLYADYPSPDLLALQPLRLTPRLPNEEEIAAVHVVWIADCAPPAAEALAQIARARRVLVNVEDVNALCDFHTPAVVRRGGLTLSAGTGGASPTVAQAARQTLAAAFPPVWGQALTEIRAARADLKAKGAAPAELAEDAKTRLKAYGLIKTDPGG